jgi:hypothetical protein
MRSFVVFLSHSIQIQATTAPFQILTYSLFMIIFPSHSTLYNPCSSNRVKYPSNQSKSLTVATLTLLLGIFLFTTGFMLALRSTQPPIQWVPGALSLGVKRPEREADYSPPTSANVRNVRSYTSTSPIRLHDVVLCQAQGQLYLYLYLMFQHR